MTSFSSVLVAGAGLAGVEAAVKLADMGISVKLVEMKPVRFSPAHKSPDFGELVCSNSLKAVGLDQASGILKEELKLLGSTVMAVAEKTRVPAGQALSVNRADFARGLTEAVESRINITVVREELTSIPRDQSVILATGPLTSEALSASLQELVGAQSLYFYDAMAPIIDGSTIDRTIAFQASRYDKGDTADYLNCPFTREEFEVFFEALTTAKTVPTRDFEEERVFQGCQPIETIASKGDKTLRFGPMKPVGLVDPRTGNRPYAVLQLRMEDSGGLAWNMVGFQTKLAFSEQERVFRLIPGLKDAQFFRLGSLHRNTFVDGPKTLDDWLRVRKAPWVQLAGQMTGVEGYLESAAMGLWAGLNLGLRLGGKTPSPPPLETAFGSLVNHVTRCPSKKYEPMNINFGIMPPLGINMRDKAKSKLLRGERALEALSDWVNRDFV